MELLDIKVRIAREEEKKYGRQDIDIETDKQNSNYMAAVPLNEYANIKVKINYSDKIVYQSQVSLHIYYQLENEHESLNNKPKKLKWDIVVEEDQSKMLEELQKMCMNAYIALPDQKSLINYLMTVFDGERVAARVKQFMAMIQGLTTDYMLKQFQKADPPVCYKSKPESEPGQDIAPKTDLTDAEMQEASRKF